MYATTENQKQRLTEGIQHSTPPDNDSGEQFTEHHPLVRVSLLETLCQSAAQGQIISMLGAVTCVMVYYGEVSNWLLFSWLLGLAIISWARIHQAGQFLKTSAKLNQIDRDMALFNVWVMASGLAWSFALIVLPPGSSLNMVGFSVMILLALIGSAVITLSALPSSFAMFAFSSCGPVIFWLIAARPHTQQMLAVLLLTYVGLMFALANRQYGFFLRNVLLRLRNEKLVKKLRDDMVQELHFSMKLEESERRLSDLFDNANDLIFIIYIDGTFAYVNRKWLETLGYTEAEMKKLNYTEVLHPNEVKASITNMSMLLAGTNLMLESVLVTKDGRQIYVDGTVNCLFNDGKPYQIRGIYRDITQRKHAEATLFEEQKKFQSIVNNAMDIIFTTDAHGRFTFVNSVGSQITGYRREELLGMNTLDLVHPAYRHKTLRLHLKQMLKGIATTSQQFPILTRSGEARWMQQNTQIVLDGGKPCGWQAVTRDITERVRMEEALVEAKEKAERSKSAEEQFIASVSHDIRTPMNAVVGFIDILSRTTLDQPQREYLRNLRHSSDLLLQIVNDLLDIKRIQAGKIEFVRVPFVLKAILDRQISIFSNQANLKGIHLACHIGETVPAMLLGDEARLSQILQNLISNAIKYTEVGGVEVWIAAENVNPDRVLLHFTVQDSGLGIQQDKLANIFDAYRQVDVRRDAMRGSGLGLAIFKNLVESQGGSVAVTSTVGVGTTFSFKLQYDVYQQSIQTTSQREIDRPLSEFESISLLLLDDEPMNVFVTLKFLDEFNNIHVTTADNGKKGLGEFSRNNYDIILTDINMPIMDGYELAKHIREDFDRPKSDVIIVALTAELAPHEKLRAAGIDDYLMKPFTRVDLHKKIHETLSRRKTT
jgi:PAS domain S-box-containing protein